MDRDKVRTAIILQGGGALGAYECGVLETLYQAWGKDFTPEVITGISIGAVNAAILAGAGIEALGDAWRTRFALLEAVPHSPIAPGGRPAGTRPPRSSQEPRRP